MTTLSARTKTTDLAIHGGPKGFTGPTGPREPKIGVEEFLAIARRFGFNDAALARLRAAVRNDDLPEGGPNLARYACPNPKPAAGDVMEADARKLFGVPFAHVVSSGTGALHAAMVAVGARPGKEVIVPALGFMATASAVVAAGGTPVFCDVDHSLQIDPTKIEALITPNTVAVAPTHHWGTVADMGPIVELAKRRGIKVVEDCAQAPGAKYRGRYVGTVGDIGCFSISAYKIIGGGEGGMILTSDERLYDRARQLAECGGLWRPNRFAPARYDSELFSGTNYRMSDLEAAVNVVQLTKLDPLVKRYRTRSLRVLRALLPCRLIQPQKVNDLDGEIGYQIRCFPRTTALSKQIAEALVAEGVGARTRGDSTNPDWHLCSHMFPLLDQKAARHGNPGDCPVAEDLYQRALYIGVDQWWTDDDADRYAAAINKVLAVYAEPDDNAQPWC